MTLHRTSGPQGSSTLAFLACAWCTFLAGALVGLHHLSHGLLAPPPVVHPGRLAVWATERGPVDVAFSLVRVGAEVACAYLLATTLGGAVARAAHLVRASRLLDRLSVPLVRRLVAALASISLATAATSLGTGSAGWAVTRAQPSLAPRTDPGTSAGNWSTPLMRVVEPPAPAPRMWRIAPGDNLWAIAATTLQREWGRRPDDAEIDTYWERLISANRDRLADPGTPDLIFPGQQLILPTP